MTFSIRNAPPVYVSVRQNPLFTLGKVYHPSKSGNRGKNGRFFLPKFKITGQCGVVFHTKIRYDKQGHAYVLSADEKGAHLNNADCCFNRTEFSQLPVGQADAGRDYPGGGTP